MASAVRPRSITSSAVLAEQRASRLVGQPRPRQGLLAQAHRRVTVAGLGLDVRQARLDRARGRSSGGPAQGLLERPPRSAHPAAVDRGDPACVQLLGGEHPPSGLLVELGRRGLTAACGPGPRPSASSPWPSCGTDQLAATRPARAGAEKDVPLHTPKPPRKSSGSMVSRGRPNGSSAARAARAHPGTSGWCSSPRRRCV